MTRLDMRALENATQGGGHDWLEVGPGDHTMRRAGERDVTNIIATQGDDRLVVGELFGDPHWVSPAPLRRRAEAAGLTFNRRSGTPLGCFARFDRAEEPRQP